LKLILSFSLYLLALVHSQPIEISEYPPPYDIVAILKVIGKQPCYVRTYFNGIQSHDYAYYETSYTILDHKIEEHN